MARLPIRRGHQYTATKVKLLLCIFNMRMRKFRLLKLVLNWEFYTMQLFRSKR